MSNWPYKTIDEDMYKMHELYGNHPKVKPMFKLSCECGLRVISGCNLTNDEKLSLIENLAIGNPWYIHLNGADRKNVAKQLEGIEYPFHLPIHPNLAAYIVALNYLHDIKECDAKILAVAFTHQMDLFDSLLIHWNIFKSDIKDEILNEWKINGDYLQEVLNL